MVRLIQLDQCHHLGDIWQAAHNTSAGTASTFVYDGVSRLVLVRLFGDSWGTTLGAALAAGCQVLIRRRLASGMSSDGA